MEEIKPKEVKEEKKPEQDPKLIEFLNKHADLVIEYGYDFGAQLNYNVNGLLPQLVVSKLTEEQLKEFKKQKDESSK